MDKNEHIGRLYDQMVEEIEEKENVGYESKPLQLVPAKTDYDIAQELKQDMMEASITTCAVMDKAVKLGFQIQTQFGLNQVTGKYVIIQCVVSKVF